MLLGLLIPTAGSITVLGRDMARDRFAALARMNFSSPYVALPGAAVGGGEPARLRPSLRRAEAGRRIAELAEELELTPFLHRPAGQLSAGQKTRVALAKSLINRAGRAAAGRADRQPGPGHGGLGAVLAGEVPRGERLLHPAGQPQHGGGGAAVLRPCWCSSRAARWTAAPRRTCWRATAETTWRRCSWTSRATGGRRHDRARRAASGACATATSRCTAAPGRGCWSWRTGRRCRC